MKSLLSLTLILLFALSTSATAQAGRVLWWESGFKCLQQEDLKQPMARECIDEVATENDSKDSSSDTTIDINLMVEELINSLKHLGDDPA